MSKVNPQNYARAFLDTLQSGTSEKQAIDGLVLALSNRADMSRRDKILVAVEREAVARGGGKMVRAEFAHALGVTERKEFLANFTDKDRVVTSINPNLVAGVRVLVDDSLELDVSLAGKLDKILNV